MSEDKKIKELNDSVFSELCEGVATLMNSENIMSEEQQAILGFQAVYDIDTELEKCLMVYPDGIDESFVVRWLNEGAKEMHNLQTFKWDGKLKGKSISEAYGEYLAGKTTQQSADAASAPGAERKEPPVSEDKKIKELNDSVFSELCEGVATLMNSENIMSEEQQAILGFQAVYDIDKELEKCLMVYPDGIDESFVVRWLNEGAKEMHNLQTFKWDGKLKGKSISEAYGEYLAGKTTQQSADAASAPGAERKEPPVSDNKKITNLNEVTTSELIRIVASKVDAGDQGEEKCKNLAREALARIKEDLQKILTEKPVGIDFNFVSEWLTHGIREHGSTWDGKLDGKSIDRSNVVKFMNRPPGLDHSRV